MSDPKTNMMKNTTNQQAQDSQGSMLSQKTNEDYNKQKPNPDAPALSSVNAYTCSKHPEVKSSKPGKCTKCGTQLIEKNETGK